MAQAACCLVARVESVRKIASVIRQKEGRICIMQDFLKIHPDDNVAVALRTLEAGRVIRIEGEDGGIVLRGEIPRDTSSPCGGLSPGRR